MSNALIEKLKTYYIEQGEEVFRGKDGEKLLERWIDMVMKWDKYGYGYDNGYLFDLLLKIFNLWQCNFITNQDIDDIIRNYGEERILINLCLERLGIDRNYIGDVFYSGVY